MPPTTASNPKIASPVSRHIKTKAKELQQELALLKGRATDPDARQFCQNIQGFVHLTPVRRTTNFPAARGGPRPPKTRARACAANSTNSARRHLRHPRTETFRKRLAGPEQKLFFTCFRRPNVPPTNNQAERSLRPVVIMRRVIQGTRSEKGLQNHSVLRSLFETARRQGNKPHHFFLDLLTKTTVQAQAALYRRSLPSRAKPSRPGERKKPP